MRDSDHALVLHLPDSFLGAAAAPTGVEVATAPKNESYVFPQPASDSMTFVFSLDSSADTTILIYDFAGNNVKKSLHLAAISGNNRVVVDISTLRPGPYYYVIKAKPVSGSEIKFPLNKFYVKR